MEVGIYPLDLGDREPRCFKVQVGYNDMLRDAGDDKNNNFWECWRG